MVAKPSGEKVIHQSLIRPILFAGMETVVAGVILSLAVALPLYSGFSKEALLLAVIFAFPIRWIAVWAASADPYALRVYLRSLQYRDHYLPFGTRKARAASVRRCIPGAK